MGVEIISKVFARYKNIPIHVLFLSKFINQIILLKWDLIEIYSEQYCSLNNCSD